MPPKKKAPSRRRDPVAAIRAHPWRWTLAACSAIATIGGAIAGWLTFEAHFQTADGAKAHSRSDDIRSMWLQISVKQLRASMIEDKVYDLAARAQTSKLSTADAVSLQRYKAELDTARTEILDLKRQASALGRGE